MYVAGRGDMVEGGKAVDEDSLHHNQGAGCMSYCTTRLHDQMLPCLYVG